jgi:sarcosine oxidase subunit alpha
MPKARRIDRPDGCPFPRGDKIQIQFEGRSLEARQGEPLAISLLAGGVQIFGRSIKYHRPRGPICLHAHCSGCLMRVDGMPNVRTCDTPARSGLVVERQSGWPGSGHDLLRAMDWIYGQRLDHHGMFTASGTINRMAMRVVRRMSGFGQLPSADAPKLPSMVRMSVPVVVIGAGLAGLQASLTLAEAGHAVLLFEHSDKIGGRLLDRACQVPIAGQAPSTGWQMRAELKARFESQREIEFHQLTPVVATFASSSGIEVVASNPAESFDVTAQRVVFACGGWDQIPAFENNDLPGIFSLRALDRLVFGWSVVPAEPILLAGHSPRTLRLALELQAAGVALAGLAGPFPECPELDLVRQRGLAVHPQHVLHRARGGRWLDRVELARDPAVGADLVLDCATLAIEADRKSVV